MPGPFGAIRIQSFASEQPGLSMIFKIIHSIHPSILTAFQSVRSLFTEVLWLATLKSIDSSFSDSVCFYIILSGSGCMKSSCPCAAVEVHVSQACGTSRMYLWNCPSNPLQACTSPTSPEHQHAALSFYNRCWALFAAANPPAGRWHYMSKHDF